MRTKRLGAVLAALSLSFSVASLFSVGDGTVAEAQPPNVQPIACNDPTVPIPDFPGVNETLVPATDTITIPEGARLCDLDVFVNVQHTWVGDLDFTLTHAGGEGPVTIIDRPGVPATTLGCGSDNYNVRVNDEGPDGDIESQCDAGPPAISGNRVGGDPAAPVLGAFDGESFAGQWTLAITDHAGGDTGQLIEWCLIPDFCLDHFMCYEIRRQPRFPGRSGDTVIDQFGASTVDVRDRKRLCNPADKNGEGITNPVDHLVAYSIRQTDPAVDTIRDIRIVNQFGEIEVDLARPDYLMVPSSKTPLMMDRGHATFGTDHFKCYDLRRGRARETVNITDQFGDLVVNTKRPERLCVPADKNGSGILNPADHLTCYRVKTDPRRQASGVPFLISNQFETETVVITGPRELCVPSLKILPGEPTPTPTRTPEPTATPTPGCGFVVEEQPGGARGAVQVCGGPCPTDQLCVFADGACRCADVSQVCQFVPPQTMPSVPGMCLGFCPGAFQICVPTKGVDACTCVFVPPGGDCCVSHPGAGCDDATCQQCVCDGDPFCCNTAWDSFCAFEASDPGICGGSCPQCLAPPTPTMTPEPTETPTPEPEPTMTPDD